MHDSMPQSRYLLFLVTISRKLSNGQNGCFKSRSLSTPAYQRSRYLQRHTRETFGVCKWSRRSLQSFGQRQSCLCIVWPCFSLRFSRHLWQSFKGMDLCSPFSVLIGSFACWPTWTFFLMSCDELAMHLLWVWAQGYIHVAKIFWLQG